MRKLEVLKHFGSVYGKSPTPEYSAQLVHTLGSTSPPDWKDYPPSLTRRTITVDGNCKADHIKTRRPDLDVWLMNGTGFMVNDAEYQDYLKIANLKEPKLVSFHLIFGFF